MSAHFIKCETLDELQQLYRKLLLEFHPDRHVGESAEAIAEWTKRTQNLNAEYAFTAAKLRRSTETARRKEHGKAEPTEAEFDAWKVADELIRQAIEKIVFLPDLDIELCGFWVWVGGETEPVKEQLGKAGYHWAPKKEKWYYPGVPSSSRGGFSMDKIRERYGSTRIKNRNHERARLEETA